MGMLDNPTLAGGTIVAVAATWGTVMSRANLALGTIAVAAYSRVVLALLIAITGVVAFAIMFAVATQGWYWIGIANRASAAALKAWLLLASMRLRAVARGS